jgi:50S ribosomal protein L16 3-hydroxylase
MQINEPSPMLGDLSPQEFMRRYWHKKPLLIKGAFKDFKPVLSRAQLFDLAASDEVHSRLVQYHAGEGKSHQSGWEVRSGPIKGRDKPAFTKEAWTLLVQGVDLVNKEAAQLLRQFRFIPDARLDDLMISYATDKGGVGPHFDSYDVFLIQASGQRLWRIGQQKDLTLREDTPLKILADFKPKKEYLLDAGDMLYLPPRYAHDGVAVGECMTYSVGFRAPKSDELVTDLLQRLGDQVPDLIGSRVYADPNQGAVSSPAQIPKALQYFAMQALAKAIERPTVFARLLGESMSEPKDHVWFQSSVTTITQVHKSTHGASKQHPYPRGVRLDDQTKMLYDDSYIFINGESWRATGADKTLTRLLANQRSLSKTELMGASADALDLINNWVDAGWAHAL